MNLHAEMRELTLAAKVSEKDYDAVLSIGDHKTFLHDVRVKEYAEVKYVWELLPPEIWQRYLDHGETSLCEQKLLRAARKALRLRWKSFLHPKEVASGTQSQ